MENRTLQLDPSLDIGHEEIEIIATHTVCRLCASQSDRLIGIFSEEGLSNDLSNKINLYLPIKVAASDSLPLQCCWSCASTLLAWHELVITSVEIDKKFRNAQLVSETEKQGSNDQGLENSDNPLSDDNDACDNEGSQEPKIITSTKKSGFCPICRKQLSRSRDLKRHISTCHPEVPESSDSAETCATCRKTFSDHLQFKKHIEDAHFSKEKRKRRKKHEISPQFFCDVCEKGFTRKYDMEKHRARAHADHVTPMRENVRSKNLEVLEKCRNKDPDGKVFYTCDFCQRSFNQTYNLMRHRTIHTGVREFFCHICGKSFRMSNGLTRHIETFHYGRRDHTCELCKKMFTTRAARDEHMNIHTNTRPFVCDVCGKSFKQKASLHVHKMFHSDTFRFECDQCGKKFRRNQDLKVHSWMHTGHRPYACGKCKAAFRLRHDLTRHLRIHEKLSECVCSDCGSVFSQQRYLNVHKKIHIKTPSILGI